MTTLTQSKLVTRASAIASLELAIIYLNDGAPNTALQRANDAVAQIEELASRRNQMIANIIAQGGSA